MSIVGIKKVTYRTNEIEASKKFYEAFGLPLRSSSEKEACFQLGDGSIVRLADSDRCGFASQVHVETTWGVRGTDALKRLVDDLSRDHQLTEDADGDVHFVTTTGLPVALGVFERGPLMNRPDPLNAPGHVARLNQWRKWRFAATPQTMNHVVYGVDDYMEAWSFFRHRLGFRLSDHSRGLGVFLRADGCHEHHNLFLSNAHFRGPGKTEFQHVCFGVEDLDELMAGANHMARQGYVSKFGLGRHRIASALFYYLDCPAGGEAEYGADTDYLDDGWVPREWNPKFGFISWATNLPPFMMDEALREVRFLESEDDVRPPVGKEGAAT